MEDLESKGGLGIYGPFVLVSIVCFSRWQWIDNWDWPPSLVIMVTLSVSFIVISHVSLHRAAIRLRSHLLKSIRVLAERHPKRISMNDRLERFAQQAREVQGGIFAGLSGNPVTRALVIPFTGVGGLAVIDYLGRI